jgi:hypothetical protein
MGLAKEVYEKLVALGIIGPNDSARSLKGYGWWQDKNAQALTHDLFPGHQMTIKHDAVEHSHNGVNVKVDHDDVPKYLHGMHTKKAGDIKPSWNAGDDEEDKKTDEFGYKFDKRSRSRSRVHT